jgi:hypothetical protein
MYCSEDRSYVIFYGRIIVYFISSLNCIYNFNMVWCENESETKYCGLKAIKLFYHSDQVINNACVLSEGNVVTIYSPCSLIYRVRQANFLFLIWNAIWKRKLACRALYLWKHATREPLASYRQIYRFVFGNLELSSHQRQSTLMRRFVVFLELT